MISLDEGGLGLIDFGMTEKLDSIERSAVVQMLVALHLRQPALMYESMVDLGAVSPVSDPDGIERALAQFMSVHLGAEAPQDEVLTGLLQLTAALGLTLPRSSTMMFRTLAILAGTLELCSVRATPSSRRWPIWA